MLLITSLVGPDSTPVGSERPDWLDLEALPSAGGVGVKSLLIGLLFGAVLGLYAALSVATDTVWSRRTAVYRRFLELQSRGKGFECCISLSQFSSLNSSH